jgi:carbamoyltransferase
VASKHLNIQPNKIYFVDHATGHAAYAFFSKKNNFKKTLVLTLDAFGDHVNYSARTFELSHTGKLKIKKLASGNEFIIGRLYRYVTLILGLKPNEHEYKVMGLAPYCKEKYSIKILKLFKKIQEVRNVDFVYKNRPKDLYFDIKKKLDGYRFDTIASGLQLYTEYLIIRWIKNLIKKTKTVDIRMAGGVAMNVKANMLISKISKKLNLFVPACPDDASQAMGACYASFIGESKKNLQNSFLNNAYLGPEAQKITPSIKKRLKKERYKIVEKNFIKKTAKLLFKCKIIGRYVGRAEFGARALGNRSILANPKNVEIKKKINERIICRDFWMPFAASVR